jgi:adenine C2-methylase RlmN of 23S rRNA A2503 and tRNA A37
LSAAEKTNLLNLDRAAMQEFFVGIGEKPFRATQVIQWIHQYGVDDFDAMTNLGKELRASALDDEARKALFGQTAQTLRDAAAQAT